MLYAINAKNLGKRFINWKQNGKNGNGRGKKQPGFLPSILPYYREITWAVEEISFTVDEGEIFGILGCNGSGKSTLIRIISTLLMPDAGELSVLGFSIRNKVAEIRRQINRVSVEASFLKRLSGMENLHLAARYYSLSPVEAGKASVEILERLGFPLDRLKDSVENLSRGMQQKLAITRGLISRPRLLLLDEPTTGLDPLSKQQVQKFLLELNENTGTTMIITTHDMEEASVMCSRVMIMKEGRSIRSGRPEDLAESKDETLEQIFIRLAQEIV